MSVADSPGVNFPPPFIHAAAVIGGLLLNRRWPLPIDAGITGEVAAALLVVLGAGLTAGSFRLFWRRRTSIIPNRPANALVITGPNRFTRNPMYLGLSLLVLALGLFLNTWWVIALLAPAIAVLQVVVIAREERYLRRRFGADYEAYARRVRRWI